MSNSKWRQRRWGWRWRCDAKTKDQVNMKAMSGHPFLQIWDVLYICRIYIIKQNLDVFRIAHTFDVVFFFVSASVDRIFALWDTFSFIILKGLCNMSLAALQITVSMPLLLLIYTIKIQFLLLFFFSLLSPHEIVQNTHNDICLFLSK